mmetsp:Transcript_88099/g.247722  ORF Transcript_88099/g.247722 Transcript_88099/m.247722 type:complete len:248 (-) Transcript_88099:42-785(-)
MEHLSAQLSVAVTAIGTHVDRGLDRDSAQAQADEVAIEVESVQELPQKVHLLPARAEEIQIQHLYLPKDACPQLPLLQQHQAQQPAEPARPRRQRQRAPAAPVAETCEVLGAEKRELPEELLRMEVLRCPPDARDQPVLSHPGLLARRGIARPAVPDLDMEQLALLQLVENAARVAPHVVDADDTIAPLHSRLRMRKVPRGDEALAPHGGDSDGHAVIALLGLDAESVAARPVEFHVELDVLVRHAS